MHLATLIEQQRDVSYGERGGRARRTSAEESEKMERRIRETGRALAGERKEVSILYRQFLGGNSSACGRSGHREREEERKNERGRTF